MIKVFYHLIIPAKNVFVIFITKNYKKTYGHIIACETIGVLRGFFIVGRFLFVYFIFYGKNDEVPVWLDVLVANIPWCPFDSSQDF